MPCVMFAWMKAPPTQESEASTRRRPKCPPCLPGLLLLNRVTMTPKKKPKRNRVIWENPPGRRAGFWIETPMRGGRKVSTYYQARGLCSVDEAASAAEVSKVSLYRWIDEGRVRAVMRDGVVRIPHSELKRLLWEARVRR